MELAEFTCPVCRATFHAPTTLAGEAAACPRCHAEIAAWPAPAHWGAKPAAASEPKRYQSAPAASAPTAQPVRGGAANPVSTADDIPLLENAESHPPRSRDSALTWWAIGFAACAILVVITSFSVGRFVAGRWSGSPEPVGGGDESTSAHASDRALVDDLVVTAFPMPGGPDGSYWFMFWVSTSNNFKNSKFVSWSDNVNQLPPMVDDLGNRYAPYIPVEVPGDPSTIIHATDAIQRARREKSLEAHLQRLLETLPPNLQNGSGSITSHIARGDLIGYEPIAPAAQKLYLKLPAANVGGAGMLNFELHVEKLQKMLK